MKTKIIAILVFASLMTKLNAQNHDKVGLLEKPVPVSSVRNITGFFGHRMEVNRNAYLNQSFHNNIIYSIRRLKPK